MKQKMKKITPLIGITAAAMIVLLSVSACGNLGGTGTVTLNLTDAPLADADNVEGIYITVNEIQYQLGQDGDEEWEIMKTFDIPPEYNLLDLQNGETAALVTDLALPAGQINQIRFMLDIPEYGQNPANPGCYIKYTDDSTDPLFVPSGGESGYKATGAFQVPRNGSVVVTADFDVRKAVVDAGQSGTYILKPTIRLIVDNEAGAIAGSVTGYTAGNDLVVYAYEDDDYSAAEAADPADEESRFPNAVTSIGVDDTDGYKLWYLAAGTYDLVVAEYDAATGDFLEAQELGSNVTVESGVTTSQDIAASGL